MTSVNKVVIRSLQKQSLEEYCSFHNVSVQDFCRRKYDHYQRELQKLKRHKTIVSDLALKHVGKLSSPSLDAVLDFDSEHSESYRSGSIKSIEAFFARHTYDRLLVDADRLKKSASASGVDINAAAWLTSYLQRIPIVILYTPSVEAYAEKLPGNTPKITVSNSLTSVFENGVIPVLLSHMFNVARDAGGMPRFHLSPQTTEPLDADSAGDTIIEMAKFYVGQRTFIDFSKTHKSEAFSLFGIPFIVGINKFVILHECAHVIYSHFEKKSEIIDEALADNLALQILIEYALTEVKRLRLGTTPGLAAGFRLFAFTLLAPMVMMHFLTVVGILKNAGSSPTHPHPSVRQWYLQDTVMVYFQNRPLFREQLELVAAPINRVFDYIYRKLHWTRSRISKHDLAAVAGLNIPVLFLESSRSKNDAEGGAISPPETPLPWFPPSYVVIRPDNQTPSVDEVVAVLELFVGNGDISPLTPQSRISGMYYSHRWGATNEPGFLHALTKTLIATYPVFDGLLTATERSFCKHGDIKFNIVSGVTNIGREYRIAELLARQRFPTKLPLTKNVACPACGSPYSVTFPQQLEDWRKQRPTLEEFEIRCNNPPCEEIAIWVEPDWVEPVGH